MRMRQTNFLPKLLARAAVAWVVAACLASALPIVAQVPQKMAYQIMALDPATGRVLANRNVDVRIELRRGAQDGPSVWSQQFSVTTDEAGICNLTLTLADTISWGAASYYLATLVDGQECGAPQVTSVPYALQAARLDGVVTKQELLGTWQTAEEGESVDRVYTFAADGICTYVNYGGMEPYTYHYTWDLNGAGILSMYDQDNFEVYATYYVPSSGLLMFDNRLFKKVADSSAAAALPAQQAGTKVQHN